MTRAQRGFTLIEVMTAGALLAFVLAASMAMLIGVDQSSERVRRVGDTQEAARLALEQIAADIRSAGMGAQLGTVGIAPAAGNTRRVPVIYSGADVTANDGATADGGAGNQLVTNSIFIISGQPTTGVLSADGSGMVGSVVAASAGTALTVACSNGGGTSVDCSDTSFGDYTLLQAQGGAFAPLIVGDYRTAVYLRPSALTGPSGTPPTQQLTYTEQTANAFSPDPKAPFGFAAGASMQRARVLHYYLWPSGDGTYYELRRSVPVLASNAGNGACDATDAPFMDETNSTTGPAGVVIGSGPIESLQIRYVLDPNATDDPQQFTMSPVGVCSGAQMPFLREVRLQVTARSLTTDKADLNSAQRMVYSTPGFEGTAPSNPGYSDSYPRRTFTINVVPRNLQGVRL